MKFWSRLWGKLTNPVKKQPEDYYLTEVTDKYVKVTHPNRPDEQIEWDELESIKLITTDEGPFLPDFWLVLEGRNKGCSIPQGCEGWDKVYDIVSKYNGFNFENMIKASGCTDNATFELWKK